MKKTIKKEFDFKIGADPEFILTMQGRKIDAKQTMDLVLSNKPNFVKSHDCMGYEIKNKDCGDIGWDGASSTAEIRPKASETPQGVVKNLTELFKAFTNEIKICDMSTISEFSSVGGHVHLEIPKGEKWTTEKKNIIQRRLSSFYLPLLISENKTNLNLRIQQGYGSIKDSRIEQHFTYPDGTPGFTLEFRAPSAEWLTTPKLATSTMAYLGVVYHEIIKNPKKFSKFNDIIFKSDKQGDALQTLAIMEYNILTQTILNKAKKYIKTFEMYPAYKTEIDYLFNPKQVIKDKQKADYNIAIGWNLIGKTLPKKSEILSSKKKIQKIAKEEDFDLLKNVMNIHYNDDTNVSLYAETLKDRVAAYNWKLKNNYYIFGIRKGIKTIISKNLKRDYLCGNEILKTTLDEEYMNNLFDKMITKFTNTETITTNPTLDFKTGKMKDTRESSIIIGIPYESRIKEDIKDFLNLIWSLEKGEIKKQKNNLLINDYDLPLEQKGEIYKILTKQNQAEQIVVDQGSISLRNHIRAINNIVAENNN